MLISLEIKKNRQILALDIGSYVEKEFEPEPLKSLLTELAYS